MNWTKVVVSGVVAGIVLWIADFVMHGFILGQTYMKYTVFSQTQANPMWFLVISVCIGIALAALFAKTRGSWADGISGGVSFGLFYGIAVFFSNFFWPLVLEGFPYYLAWCWGGINLVEAVLAGIVIALIYK